MSARWTIAVAAAAIIYAGTSRAAHAKGCHEGSDVVGYHHCTIFGAMWSRDADTPKLDLELGYFSHRFTALPFSLGDAPLVVGGGGGGADFRTRAQGVTTRVVVGIGRALYLGGEIDGGGMTTLPRPLGTQPNTGTLIAVTAVAGVHLLELYRIALSTEVAAGGRIEDIADCIKYSGKTCIGPSSVSGRRELEARVRIDAFIHPNLSIGVGYGASLLEGDDRTFMLTVGIHARAIDGMY